MVIAVPLTLITRQKRQLEPGSFDRVLVDAPCSNTGVLARRAEARWRFSKAALSSRVKDQKFLIQAAGQFVRPGGLLVYSTRSIEPEECSELADWCARSESRMSLKDQQLTLPGGAGDPTQWRDGGYVAIFEAQ